LAGLSIIVVFLALARTLGRLNALPHVASVEDPPNPNLPSSPQYYRAQAEYCRQQAEQAGDEGDIRQKYRELAAKWEGLARAAETS
jgi:hypothetical protein